ncbi:MAG: O-antigen ligase family protein [Caryophanon sp.]|nr:O-antigen ligase family protein [Caryophanon sp.]
MEKGFLLDHNANNVPFIFLIISYIFSYYYIDIGFALKPFMILSLIFLVLSLKKFKIHKLMGYELAMLIFFFYYCSTGFFAKYPMYSLRLALGIMLVVTCYFIMRYIISLATLEKVKQWVLIGGLIFNGLSLSLYFIGLASLNFVIGGNQIKSYGVWMDRGFPRLNGLIGDPNVFCFYNFLFFFFALTHLDRKWAKICLLLSGTTMLLSFSRGGILAIAFSLFFVFIYSSFKKKLILLTVLPAVGVLVNLILTKLFEINIFAMVGQRFLATSEDNGSGRTVLWSRGIEFFSESPLFGLGLFNYRAYSEVIYGSPAYMHNTFMDVLVDGGLVGIALYTILFISILVTYFKNINIIADRGFILFTFIAMIIFMMTYSLMTNEAFFIMLVVFWKFLNEAKNNSLTSSTSI